GKIRKERTVTDDGTVQERHRVKVTFTYDDRIADGIYCGKAIDLFRGFVENPDQLATPLEITPALRSELMLKE
ncbi:MAG TPA: 2-oxo acid dehydrogenase subunit E2, partial [Spirochaetia bacterium]|nr:2-oxo acid dehydrogenase subunit E2 [Spirochaetia bacterium]